VEVTPELYPIGFADPVEVTGVAPPGFVDPVDDCALPICLFQVYFFIQ
jgi:hypothetical protein